MRIKNLYLLAPFLLISCTTLVKNQILSREPAAEAPPLIELFPEHEIIAKLEPHSAIKLLKSFDLEVRWQCAPEDNPDDKFFDTCPLANDQIFLHKNAVLSEDGKSRIFNFRKIKQRFPTGFRFRFEYHFYQYNENATSNSDRVITLGKFRFYGKTPDDFRNQKIPDLLGKMTVFNLQNRPTVKLGTESGNSFSNWLQKQRGQTYWLKYNIEFGQQPFLWSYSGNLDAQKAKSTLDLSPIAAIYPSSLGGANNPYSVKVYIEHQVPFQIGTTNFASAEGVFGFQKNSVLDFRVNDCLYDNLDKPVKCSRRPECEEMGFKSFIIYGSASSTANLAPPDIDYCRVTSPEENFKSALPIMRAFHSQNLRIAEKLGAPLRKILPGDLKLVLIATTNGPLASWYSLSTGELAFGIFPKESVQNIDFGVYTHEIGHYLSFSKKVSLNKSMQLLFQSPLFMETASDILAILLEGKVVTEAPDIRCEVRRITDHQGYSAPRGFFDLYYSTRRNLNCCRRLETIPVEQQNVSPYWNWACKSLLEQKDEILKKIGELDQSAADPKTFFDTNLTPIDPHQIGIPITSFLHQLAVQRSDVPFSLVLDFAKSVKPESISEKVECELPLPNGHIKRYTKIMASARKFFSNLRASLTPEQIADWDSLWAKKNLEIGMNYGDQSQVLRANSDVFWESLTDKEVSEQCQSDSKPQIEPLSSNIPLPTSMEFCAVQCHLSK